MSVLYDLKLPKNHVEEITFKNKKKKIYYGIFLFYLILLNGSDWTDCDFEIKKPSMINRK